MGRVYTSILAIALVASFVGWREGAAQTVPVVPAAPTEPTNLQTPPGGHPPGGCQNVGVDGPCAYSGVLNRVDPEEGFPVRPDAPPGSDGTVTFSAAYHLVHSVDGVSPAVWVRAGLADRAALERHFNAHRNARCVGVIIRAPCPPGVHVTVAVPPPPVGTVVRSN